MATDTSTIPARALQEAPAIPERALHTQEVPVLPAAREAALGQVHHIPVVAPVIRRAGLEAVQDRHTAQAAAARERRPAVRQVPAQLLSTSSSGGHPK